MPRLLIVQTGSAPDPIRKEHGDFDHWFIDALGRDRFDYQVVAVDRGQALPSDHQDLAGVLVTGSPAMVSHRLDWSEATAEWIAQVHQAGLPMLGVCYGHQLIAHALGGQVGANPAGRRMGTKPVEVLGADDALLSGLGESLAFHVTHMEAVLEPPPGSRVIARTDGDPHHALFFGQRSWGVQFHPEFDEKIMACYIRLRADAMREEGIDPDRLLTEITAAPAGPALMTRFADLVMAA
jgi:GMP synthase (glutamine-hydrolysing)